MLKNGRLTKKIFQKAGGEGDFVSLPPFIKISYEC